MPKKFVDNNNKFSMWFKISLFVYMISSTLYLVVYSLYVKFMSKYAEIQTIGFSFVFLLGEQIMITKSMIIKLMHVISKGNIIK